LVNGLGFEVGSDGMRRVSGAAAGGARIEVMGLYAGGMLFEASAALEPWEDRGEGGEVGEDVL